MGKRPLSRKQEMKREKRRLGLSDDGTYDRIIGQLISNRLLRHVLNAAPHQTKPAHARLREDLRRHASDLQYGGDGGSKRLYSPIRTPMYGRPRRLYP